MKITIHYDTLEERNSKLATIMRRFGFIVEPARPERITVGELARRVNRRRDTVSMSLRRPSCPPYTCLRGKRRILWIEPTEKLLTYLAENRKGQRQL